MTSVLAQWPSGPVRLSWIPQPEAYPEPVTAVHCFCFSNDHLVLVDVKGRGASIPGGHLEAGESLVGGLQRELAEEACVAVRCPVLLGAIECDQSENPRFDAGFPYPKVASQLLYASTVRELRPFSPEHETARRILIPAVECPRRHHEWNDVLQAAFDAAVAWGKLANT